MALYYRLYALNRSEATRNLEEIVIKKDFGVKTDGKPDPDKIRPITYDPVNHGYRGLTAPLGKAFQG